MALILQTDYAEEVCASIGNYQGIVLVNEIDELVVQGEQCNA